MLLNLLNSAARKRTHIVFSPSVVPNWDTSPHISKGKHYLSILVTNC